MLRYHPKRVIVFCDLIFEAVVSMGHVRALHLGKAVNTNDRWNAVVPLEIGVTSIFQRRWKCRTIFDESRRSSPHRKHPEREVEHLLSGADR